MSNYIFKHIGLTDGVKEVVTITGSETQQGAGTEQLNVALDHVPYSSLELNKYDPKKPRKIYKGDTLLGYATKKISTEKGVINDTLFFDFGGNAFSFNGLTLYTEQVLTDFSISGETADGETVSKQYRATESPFYADFIIDDCINITLEIKAIQGAKHFLRFYGIDYGKIETFDDSNIEKAEIENEINLSTRENPLSALKLTLLQDNKRRLFQQNQPIKVYRDGELINDFFISQGVATKDGDPEISIECLSCLNNLTTKYYGGMYTKPIKVSALIEDILKDTDVSFVMADEIKGNTVTGYIPICSKREALLYCSAAVGACIDDSTLTLKIFKPNYIGTATHEFDETSIVEVSDGENTSQEIAGVDFIKHNYSLGEEIKTAYQWYMSTTENKTIEFSEPLHSLKAYEITEDGDGNISSKEEITNTTNKIEFMKKEANYCICRNHVTDKKILIEGRSYIDSTETITVKAKYVNPNKTYKVESVSDMTLVGDAEEVANQLYYYYKKNKRTSCAVLTDSVQLNQRVNLSNVPKTVTRITNDTSGITRLEVI